MRRGGILLLLVLAAAGCGGAQHTTATTTRTTTRAAPARPLLSVGVVGPLRVAIRGVATRHGRLTDVAGERLVLVDAHRATPEAVAAVAQAHPTSRFAIVGASARAQHVPNLTGIVLDEKAAAYLAGVTAGLSAAATGGTSARVAWVGPEEEALAAAFGRGVRAAAPGVAVLHQWSRTVPARCEEAALTAIDRGAVVVAAHGGLCAEAAAAGAHDQNVPALRLGDFLLPDVAAALVVREDVNGLFHGGQDVLLGPSSGAVGVRVLDPRVPASAAARARAAAQDVASGVASAG